MVATEEQAPDGSARGMSFAAAASLISIVLVLVLVSLPRLQDFALHQNSLDAGSTVRSLAEHVRSLAPLAPNTAGTVGSTATGGQGNPTEAALDPASLPAPRIGELFDRQLSHTLSDAELLEEGALLRRHGYLFQLLRRPAQGDLAILAWPWSPHPAHARVLCWTEADGLLELTPVPASFCGPEADVAELLAAGPWRAVGREG